MKFSWLFVVLCALLLGANVKADEKENRQPDMAAMEQQEAAEAAEIPVILNEEIIDKDEAPDAGVDKQMPEQIAIEADVAIHKPIVVEMKDDDDKEYSNDIAFEESLAKATENSDIMKQPGMQRLARQLHNFHNYNLYRANAMQGRNGGFANDYEEDDGIVPEERAVRRRKRVRRRNTKNKVKRRHRNNQVANRRKSSRRKVANKNFVKRKNSNKMKAKRSNKRRNKRTRLNNSSKRNVKRRRNSSSRSPSKRRRSKKSAKNSSKRSSSKRKSSKKKRNKKKKRTQKEPSDDDDANSARKQQEGVAQEAAIDAEAAPAAK